MKRLITISLAIFFICSSGSVWGQIGTIEGVVLDSKTSKPIEDVLVKY